MRVEAEFQRVLDKKWYKISTFYRYYIYQKTGRKGQKPSQA